MPTPRTSLGVAVVNGILYAVGGTVPLTGGVATVEAYDPATNTWTTKAPMLNPRTGLAAAAVNGMVYAIGGSLGPATAGDVEPADKRVEVYDPATNSWTAGPPTGVNYRGDLAGGVVNSTLYAVGGSSIGTNGFFVIGTLEALTPPVADVTPPVVTPPPDISVSADPGLCSANVSPGSATAIDDRDGSVPATPDVSGPYLVGTTTVTWTATDAAGNAASATQEITVADTEFPSLTAPADIATTTDPGQATATVDPGTATATDNCRVLSLVGLRGDGQPLGAPYPVGTTIISWSAVDPSGNGTVTGRTIQVRDAERPAVSVPASFAVNATSASGAAVTFGVTATDNVGVTSTVCTPASGSLFPIGTTTVSCTASDAAGNTASAGFAVTVKGASQQMTELEGTVEGLNLHEGTETSLKAKLDAALAAHAAGNTSAACGQLDAMIGQITAQIDRRISAADAADLIAEINRIRAVVGC